MMISVYHHTVLTENKKRPLHYSECAIHIRNKRPIVRRAE